MIYTFVCQRFDAKNVQIEKNKWKNYSILVLRNLGVLPEGGNLIEKVESQK